MPNAPVLRRTKIVATLGPSSQTPEVLARMIEAGLDVARFNLSHGSTADHRERLAALREAARRLSPGRASDPSAGSAVGRRVGVLFDLQGPEIRLGSFAAGPVTLAEGAVFTITTAPVPGTVDRVSVGTPAFPGLVRPGDLLLLDDGNLALEVREVRRGKLGAGGALSGDPEAGGVPRGGPGAGGVPRGDPGAGGPEVGEVVCRVKVGGVLSDHKKINVPGRRLDVPFLSPKDEADLGLAVEVGADFVAASFVRRAEDIDLVRDFLWSRGGRQMIVAKIESQEALEDLDRIIEAADGLMVARGDLGVEVPAEDVPVIQKDLIARAMAAGKPVITATQMLESMIEHPRPTRAEASDVANAIFDGTDAVMLSAETATGRYPVEAVATLARIAERAEAALLARRTSRGCLPVGRLALGTGQAAGPSGAASAFDRATAGAAPGVSGVTAAISLATVTIAAELDAGAIVTATTSGYTARMVARHRPAAPIIAVTSHEEVARQQTLTWGVYPVRVGEARNTDEMFQRAVAAAWQAGFVEPGSAIVVTAGVPPGTAGTTNLIKVHTLGRVLARGTGVVPASATGTVRVCRSAAEAVARVGPGDVLAARRLDENWFGAMEKALAWIVEEPGEASFAAVQARALDRVAIVGAAGATRDLPDGEVVTLDGARGLVYEGRAQVL